MKKNLLITAALLLSASSAFATIDSYIEVKIPVLNMQDDGYFFAVSPAWDGVSGGMSHVPLALKTLQAPLRVQGFQAGEDQDGWIANVNELHSAGIVMSDLTDYDNSDSSMAIKVSIDATAAVKIMSAAEATKRTKLAIYSVVSNLARFTKKLEIVLVGVPSQEGIKNPLPTKFAYPFTSKSPFLAMLKKDLSI